MGFRECLLLASAAAVMGEAIGGMNTASWIRHPAFAGPSTWSQVQAGARGLGNVADSRPMLLAKGGRATRLGDNLVMMAKKIVRPVSKGFGVQKDFKGAGKELRDKTTTELMDWLKSGGASVSKVAIADFKGLRGVAARQAIEEGDDIVSIPQNLALQLGSDGVNPGYAAANLCKIEKSEERRAAGWFQPFLDVLPKYEHCDTTDFFSKEELAALEWEPVIEETRTRLEMLKTTYDASQITGVDRSSHDDFTWEQFLWGVYQVVSRVLTIYTDAEGGQKYLIPMIDMFNHDPKSVHQLKCTGGQFKVIAGKRINEGEQINILYGAGKLNNDRLIQDYGFVQTQNEFDIKQLISRKTQEPIAGFPFAGMGMGSDALRQMLEGFSTTLEQDEALLAAGDFNSNNMRAAVAFRAEKKRAIQAAIKQLV